MSLPPDPEPSLPVSPAPPAPGASVVIAPPPVQLPAPLPPPEPAPPLPAPAPLVPPSVPPAGVVGRIAVAVTAALFLGWLGWLGYTALNRSRAPVVSHAQAAEAAVAVRVRLADGNRDQQGVLVSKAGATKTTNAFHGEDGKPSYLATVEEPLTPTGPAAGTEIGVENLPQATGYAGPGEYLLLLNKLPEATIDGRPAYVIVGPQRSPGADLSGPLRVYPWTDQTGEDLRRQVRTLYP